MSFIKEKTLNPHLHLLAIKLDSSLTQEQATLHRVNYLAKTRMFDQLLIQSAKLKDIQFPTLHQKIELAKEKTKKEKESLNEHQIFDIIKELDVKSKAEEANSEEVDIGQEKVYRYAKILFDQGKYEQSFDIITLLEKQDLKDDLWLKATWARLYCEVILRKDQCIRTAEYLKRKIEEIQSEELKYFIKDKIETAKIIKKYYAQKQQFLYLSCFIFFSKARDDDLQKFVEICTSDKSYFSVVQLLLPELLRYICVAIILNKTLQSNRNFDMFKLIEVINRKIIKYRDPFLDFIVALHIDFNFESTQEHISKIKDEIRKDFLLKPLEARLIESCHFLYFKVTCKVYQTISLSEIAKFTGKTKDQAELWILKYIRSSDIDAKIDSITETIINNKNKQNNIDKYVDVLPNVSVFINSLSRAIEKPINQ